MQRLSKKNENTLEPKLPMFEGGFYIPRLHTQHRTHIVLHDRKKNEKCRLDFVQRQNFHFALHRITTR
jgi:hypothetical protein